MSTGPRTPEGKQASARNSLKHGLTARQAVLPGESQADFDALIASLRAQYKPEGPLELEICDEIAASLWRLQRARAQESLALQQHGDRIFSGDFGIGRAFDRILRYQGAIERQFNRAIARLQQLQSERRKLERAAAQPEKPAKPAPPEFVSSRTSSAAALPVEIAFNRQLKEAS